jgi:hypothetical protein
MAVYNFKKALLAVTSAVNTDQTGDSFAVLEGGRDEELVFKVWFDLTQAGGATSPTAKAVLQTSHDKLKWATVVESTQLAADGALSEWKAAADLGPYIRVITVLGGATKPNHTASAYLMAYSPFKLKNAA